MDLTDRQWAAIRAQVPPAHLGRGRPALDSRRVLDGIFWKVRSDSSWRRLPSRYPSHQSCHRFLSSGRLRVCLIRCSILFIPIFFYRGNFFPYQAVAEKRILGKAKNRSFILYILPLPIMMTGALTLLCFSCRYS